MDVGNYLVISDKRGFGQGGWRNNNSGLSSVSRVHLAKIPNKNQPQKQQQEQIQKAHETLKY